MSTVVVVFQPIAYAGMACWAVSAGFTWLAIALVVLAFFTAHSAAKP